MKIFFSSDHHFHHANIIRHCSRPFSNIKEMDAELIRLWNETVSPEDTVYYLGDFCWGNVAASRELRRVLNGTIHLILGNHDRGPKAMVAAGFNSAARSTVLHEPGVGTIRLTHRPPETPEDFQGCRHSFCGHVHDAWRTRQLGWAKTINVGVDVNGYVPVELESLVKELES